MKLKCAGKVRFDSLENAKKRIKELRPLKTGIKNAYRCNVCGFYHLTKMTKKNYTEGVLNRGFGIQRMVSKAYDIAKRKGWDNSQFE